MEDSDYSNQHIWSEDVLAKRIFYLLTNLSFFFETANESFQKNLQRILINNVNYFLNPLIIKKKIYLL